jgi:hypothetical protein
MSGFIGLGDDQAQMRVYIGNRPAFSFDQDHSHVIALQKGEISAVGQVCGNGWRKVFNVYAKLMFALAHELPIAKHCSEYDNWQAYRDQGLLQADSNTALVFSGYQCTPPEHSIIHLVMGRTYASSLPLPASLQWLGKEFAFDAEHKLIVCPYFDYRQLSNSKIIHLVDLLSQFKSA